MLYRIDNAIAHPDHTVTVTWSDGVTAVVDLAPAIAKGRVFEAMRETWRGRIELQAACLLGIEGVRDTKWFEGLAKRVAAAKGVLGGVPLSPKPRRSVVTTVKCSASCGATRCHMR